MMDFHQQAQRLRFGEWKNKILEYQTEHCWAQMSTKPNHWNDEPVRWRTKHHKMGTKVFAIEFHVLIDSLASFDNLQSDCLLMLND